MTARIIEFPEHRIRRKRADSEPVKVPEFARVARASGSPINPADMRERYGLRVALAVR